MFLHEHLLPSLTSRSCSGVATSSLKSWVSALGRCFDLRGRSRDWCDERVRNPVPLALVAALVLSAVRAYQRQHTAVGARSCSAVAFFMHTSAALISRMDMELRAAAAAGVSSRVSVLLRDAPISM